MDGVRPPGRPSNFYNPATGPAGQNSVRRKTMNNPATVIPCMRYRDASKAIDWLCQAFGFEKHLVVPEEGNRIAHAQLTYGNGMIMLGSVHDNEFGRMMRQPNEIGG